MKKIIRIEPTNPVFSVIWNIGLRCNFDCMYCPSFFHNLTDLDKSLDELKSDWIEIFNKTQQKQLKYKIAFTGGEVTLNKNFLPFLEWLNVEYSNYISEVGFTTNGSANQQYYIKLIELNIITYVCFSTHSEFFNEQKFFKTVKAVHKRSIELNKSMHVNVMNEYWNTAQNNKYVEYLTANGINCSLNEIDYSHKIRDAERANTNKKLFKFYEQR